MSKPAAHTVNIPLPVFAGVVTVPGSYFMPLVEAAIAGATWIVRKSGALARR